MQTQPQAWNFPVVLIYMTLIGQLPHVVSITDMLLCLLHAPKKNSMQWLDVCGLKLSEV